LPFLFSSRLNDKQQNGKSAPKNATIPATPTATATTAAADAKRLQPAATVHSEQHEPNEHEHSEPERQLEHVFAPPVERTTAPHRPQPQHFEQLQQQQLGSPTQ